MYDMYLLIHALIRVSYVGLMRYCVLRCGLDRGSLPSIHAIQQLDATDRINDTALTRQK